MWRTTKKRIAALVAGSVVAVAVGGTLAVVNATQAAAWTATPTATAKCNTDGIIVISGTLANNETTAGGDMSVTMSVTGKSDGPKAVAHGTTWNFSVNTGVSSVTAGTATFALSWIGRSGSDTRTASYGALSCVMGSVKANLSGPTQCLASSETPNVTATVTNGPVAQNVRIVVKINSAVTGAQTIIDDTIAMSVGQVKSFKVLPGIAGATYSISVTGSEAGEGNTSSDTYTAPGICSPKTFTVTYGGSVCVPGKDNNQVNRPVITPAGAATVNMGSWNSGVRTVTVVANKGYVPASGTALNHRYTDSGSDCGTGPGTKTVTVQVDSDVFYASKCAAKANAAWSDGSFAFREMAWMWMTPEGKACSKENWWKIVTVSVPVNASNSQVLAAVRKKTGLGLSPASSVSVQVNKTVVTAWYVPSNGWLIGRGNGANQTLIGVG